MIQFILGLGTMLVVAFLFTKIRGFIINRAKSNLAKGYKAMSGESEKIAKETYPAQVKALNLTEQEIEKDIDKTLEKVRLNASIGKSYPKGKEPFSWTKFKKIFDLGSLVEWIKSCKEMGILDVRKWVIMGVIVSSFFAYGYFKGQGNTPIKIDLDYAKEFKMKLDSHFLVKPKNSEDLRIEDKKGNVIKNIKAKDFPLLAKKLKPIGFILEPVGIIGLGAGGDKSGVEYGAGVSFIKYWQWKLDGFLTNRGIYVGTSYQITDNTGLGLGVGKGYTGDNRIILYGKVRF